MMNFVFVTERNLFHDDQSPGAVVEKESQGSGPVIKDVVVCAVVDPTVVWAVVEPIVVVNGVVTTTAVPKSVIKLICYQSHYKRQS